MWLVARVDRSLGQHCGPVHGRHHDIKQDRIRLMPRGAFNGLGAAISFNHVPPSHGMQAVRRRVACCIVIVHNENAPFHSHLSRVRSQCQRYSRCGRIQSFHFQAITSGPMGGAMCRPFGLASGTLRLPGTAVPGDRLCRPRSTSSGQALRDCSIAARFKAHCQPVDVAGSPPFATPTYLLSSLGAPANGHARRVGIHFRDRRG